MLKKIKNWMFPPKDNTIYSDSICAITIYTNEGKAMQNINLRRAGMSIAPTQDRLIVVLNCTQHDVDYHM